MPYATKVEEGSPNQFLFQIVHRLYTKAEMSPTQRFRDPHIQ